MRIQTLIPFLMTAVLGCGSAINTDYGSLGLVDVSGVVTFDDQPVVNAVVVFEAEDGTLSSGTTDGSGEYTLQFNSEQSGVMHGKKTVRISTSAPASDEEFDDESEEDEWDPDGSVQSRQDSELIPACYNTESRLTVTVSSDSNWLPFRLRRDCSTTGSEP